MAGKLLTATELAESLGIHRENAILMARRLGIQPVLVTPRGRLFSEEQLETMRAQSRNSAGLTVPEICARYGISRHAVGRALRKRSAIHPLGKRYLAKVYDAKDVEMIAQAEGWT